VRTSSTLGRYSSAIRAACANERSCGSVRGAISNGRPYRDLIDLPSRFSKSVIGLIAKVDWDRITKPHRRLHVLYGDVRLPGPTLEEKLAEEAEDIDLALTPRTPEAGSDPVRIYLREMGASSLLTREGEVDIAKRIERGQMSALKALSRSPLVIHQVLAIGDDLKRGLRSIKETVVFDDEEEITEDSTPR
jgi:Sigma-70 factor, region 1.2